MTEHFLPLDSARRGQRRTEVDRAGAGGIANLQGQQFCEMDKNMGMSQVKEVAFNSGTLTKNGDVLALTAEGAIQKLVYSVSVQETSTLTLAH